MRVNVIENGRERRVKMFYQTIKDNGGVQNVTPTTIKKALHDLRYFYRLERAISRLHRQEKNLFLLAGDTSRAHVWPILINPGRRLHTGVCNAIFS